MIKKIRFYISPYFLIRYYLQRDIRYFTKKYKFQGKVLDFGCGQKPYENFFVNSEYIGIDFEDYSKNKDVLDKTPDFYFDEKYSKDLRLPFENENFDHAVSFQVLEHHKKPELMISEMARVIKSGGLILLSCPFIYALHEEPHDYQRFTEYKLRILFRESDCKVIEIKKQGSWFSVSSTLANEQLSAFAAKGTSKYFLAAVIYLPFFLFQYLSLFLDKIVKSDKVFINYIILAKKK
jgi:SAM-dependent methyltransferase